jgi:hypothetical protein
MAGRGPAPAKTTRRTNKSAVPTTEVTVDDALRGPELPEFPSAESDWHPMTRKWWDIWRRSPQAQAFVETDWSFLLDTALMHHAMWSKGQWTLAAEVRLRAAKFGATPEDRARLKMEVVPQQAPAKAPTAAEARKSAARDPRARLKLVNDSQAS